jgi:peptide/nickel transport system substrate-binding protein/oligopeptide transport system substrate-binding protein
MEAVGNQLREHLGLEFSLQGNLDFAEYLPLGESKGFTGPYRYGWSFDYPSADSYLTPLLTPSQQPPAGSNYSFYDNPEVTDLIAQGDQASSPEDAIALYQEAEDLVVQDMPMAPLFFTEIQSVHSENVDNVSLDIFQRVRVADVTVVG